MTETTNTTTQPKVRAASSTTLVSGSPEVTVSRLITPEGRTTIADTVVAKIAGVAAHEASSVYALGGGAARAVGALRERIPGSRTNRSQGVAVEVGESQTAVDIALVAEYGVAIADLAAGHPPQRHRFDRADDGPGGDRGEHRGAGRPPARRGRP